ncbi:MAG: glycosyltransferase, partial [Flavobacterium sp.]
MKILTLVESLGIGGTERVAQNFSIGYQNLNCETKVLTTNGLGKRSEYLTAKNIEVFDGKEDLAKSIKAIIKWKPDIIHIHRPGYFNEMNNLLHLLKTTNTKVVETNIFARPDFSKSANLVDVHFHLSNWCLWKWGKWTRGLNQIGAVIPNLIDCEKFKNKPNRLSRHLHLASLSHQAIILGRVGQPIAAKWDIVIFDVLAELLKKNQNYYLVLVGLPPELKTSLKGYDKMVQDHTILIDTISNDDELNSLYQDFDVFLHASKIGESFGMVLAEAHLNKVPIVTMNTPLKDNSQNEIVGNNRGGFVVSDKRNMIKAIEKLTNDKALGINFGLAGQQYIIHNFEMNLIAGKSLQLCEILQKNLNKNKTCLEINQNGVQTKCDDSTIQALNQNIMG